MGVMLCYFSSPIPDHPEAPPWFTKGPSLALDVLPLTGTQDYDNI